VKRVLSLVFFLAIAVSPAAAQQSRSALIDAALASSDEAARYDLLIRALDPDLGPPDSLWAVGAYSVAFALAQAGRDDDAAHWLRWAARDGGALGLSPADFPAYFPPPLVDAYGRARAQVDAQAVPGDASVTSDWDWPSTFSGTDDGSLEVRVVGAGSGAAVEVEGVGTLTDGQSISLPAGTYRILVSGEGVEPLAVRREVLPGVSRVLNVAATAILFPGAQANAERSLVRLRRGGGGAQICSSGVAAGNGGLVLAPLSLVDAVDLEVIAPDGRIFTRFDVPARDENLGVGVLRFGDVGLTPLGVNQDAPGDATWALFHDGCGPVSLARVDLGAESNGERSVGGVTASAAGGAILDQQGRLIALGLGATAVVAAELDDLLDEALDAAPFVIAPTGPAAARASEDSGGGGGGFPLKWVAAGVAVVGVAALLAGGGGGGGEDDPGKTGIIIIFPAG
jgi:hypothetical protein